MSWTFLLEIGLKASVIAAITLGLLRLLRNRSASERSVVAHAGLTAMLLLPLIVPAMPAWQIEAPSALAWAKEPVATATSVAAAGSTSSPAAAAPVPGALDDGLLAALVYAIPAAALVLLTLFAVFRVSGIRRRAVVMTDPRWLDALARVRRRMGCKRGVALLCSREVRSPASWGLFRPAIVLDEHVRFSAADAEAVIAHELAHIVRWDWSMLLVGRLATDLHWFNPLAWMLARQCHQLREEAADDAVLRSDVIGLDYAELLVGVARHQRRTMTFAANGVAPFRDSLKRRVERALDAGLSRTPSCARWRAGWAAGAILFSAPLAAVTIAGEPSGAAMPQVIVGHQSLRADAGAGQKFFGPARGRGMVQETRPAPVLTAAEANGGPRMTSREGAERLAGSGGARAVAARQPMLRIPEDNGPVVIPEDRPYAARRIVPSRLRRDDSERLIYYPCTTNCDEEPSADEMRTPPTAPAEAHEGGKRSGSSSDFADGEATNRDWR